MLSETAPVTWRSHRPSHLKASVTFRYIPSNSMDCGLPGNQSFFFIHHDSAVAWSTVILNGPGMLAMSAPLPACCQTGLKHTSNMVSSAGASSKHALPFLQDHLVCIASSGWRAAVAMSLLYSRTKLYLKYIQVCHGSIQQVHLSHKLRFLSHLAQTLQVMLLICLEISRNALVSIMTLG